MITYQHYTYQYPNADTATLSDLTLDIPEGAFVLVMGPSGAGKSTFLRTINGLAPHF
jgi:energy-coupling factor transporter ATP-binding protein EcfA2